IITSLVIDLLIKPTLLGQPHIRYEALYFYNLSGQERLVELKSRYPLSELSPSLMSILIIVVFTTIAISIVGSKLVIFSEGQKAPSINTHNINNTSSNLIKWHIINASKGSTSITPAKSSNKITISDSGMETQQQSQLRAEPNASTIITTGSNATAK